MVVAGGVVRCVFTLPGELEGELNGLREGEVGHVEGDRVVCGCTAVQYSSVASFAILRRAGHVGHDYGAGQGLQVRREKTSCFILLLEWKNEQTISSLSSRKVKCLMGPT